MDMPFHYHFALLTQYLDVLRAKLRIAVVYGGDKQQPGAVVYQTHNARAWKSYKAVADDIQTALHELGFASVITLPDDMRLPQRLADEGIHLAWLNTGGVQGYNPVSHAPAMLEMMGIPYVGHNPLNAALLDNKDAFKRSLQALGIRTAPFMSWHPSQGALPLTIDSRLSAIFGDYRGPFVIKPVSGRASLHVYVADSWQDVPEAARKVYDVTRNNVLIEAYVPGREFCVAVQGPVTYAHGTLVEHSAPVAFSALERTLEPGERIFTSMDRKPITTDRFRLIDETEPELKHNLLELARTIYTEFNLQSIARVDVRADADGYLYVLEANPKPDLKKPTEHSTSLVMAGPLANGVCYTDLILGLLADRIHAFLTYERDNVEQIVNLLTQGEHNTRLFQTPAPSKRKRQAATKPGTHMTFAA